MYNPRIEISKPKRLAKCKLCEKKLKNDEDAVVMANIYISPHLKTLWFHKYCFISSVKKLGYWSQNKLNLGDVK